MTLTRRSFIAAVFCAPFVPKPVPQPPRIDKAQQLLKTIRFAKLYGIGPNKLNALLLQLIKD